MLDQPIGNFIQSEKDLESLDTQDGDVKKIAKCFRY